MKTEMTDERLAAQERRYKVLMVDDDRDFQLILRGWLSPRYDTISLSDGDELLEETELSEPDLVILDVSLPGADGFKLCKRLREQGRFGAVPVLFLTGYDTNEDFLKSLEVGGSAFLTKPVKRTALLAEVGKLLGQL